MSDNPHLVACDLALEGDDPTATRKLRIVVRHAGGPPAEQVEVVARFSDVARVGLCFQTRPERSLLGKLTAESGGELRFHITRLAGTVLHAWLFHVRAPEEEVATVEVRYQHPDEGERILVSTLASAALADNEATPEEEELPDRRRAASVALEAYRAGARGRCSASLRALARAAQNDEERGAFEEMAVRLEAGRALSHEMLDLCFRISHEEEIDGEASLFDVVLTGTGDAHIAVVREIRAAIGLPLNEVNELVDSDVAAIGHALPFAQAGALKRRIEAAGGTVEIRRRSAPLEKTVAPPPPEQPNEEDERKQRRARRRRRR